MKKVQTAIRLECEISYQEIPDSQYSYTEMVFTNPHDYQFIDLLTFKGVLLNSALEKFIQEPYLSSFLVLDDNHVKRQVAFLSLLDLHRARQGKISFKELKEKVREELPSNLEKYAVVFKEIYENGMELDILLGLNDEVLIFNHALDMTSFSEMTTDMFKVEPKEFEPISYFAQDSDYINYFNDRIALDEGIAVHDKICEERFEVLPYHNQVMRFTYQVKNPDNYQKAYQIVKDMGTQQNQGFWTIAMALLENVEERFNVRLKSFYVDEQIWILPVIDEMIHRISQLELVENLQQNLPEKIVSSTRLKL